MIKNVSGFTLLSLFFGAAAFSQTTSVLVSAGYSLPEHPQLAPGQYITLFYSSIGLLPGGQPRSATADAPLPTLLAGLSAQIIQDRSLFNVPLSKVSQKNVCDNGVTGPACLLTSVTVQIPFEIAADPTRDPQSGAVTPAPPARITFYADGQLVAVSPFQPVTDNAHVLTTCDLQADPQAGISCDRMAFHRNNTPADAASPAAKGETIGVLLYGLGQTSPAAVTGEGALPGYFVTDLFGVPRVTASFTPFVNALASTPRSGHAPDTSEVSATITQASLLAGKVGLYELAITVPDSLTPPIACGGTVRSNYILSVNTSQGTERIPICIAN